MYRENVSLPSEERQSNESKNGARGPEFGGRMPELAAMTRRQLKELAANDSVEKSERTIFVVITLLEMLW